MASAVGVLTCYASPAALASRRRRQLRCASCSSSSDPEAPERSLARKPESLPERRMRLMGDLAVLNSKLAGNAQPHLVRRKVEYLQRRRRNWELILEYVTRSDAAVTLKLIETANAKVRAEDSENPSRRYLRAAAHARTRAAAHARRERLPARRASGTDAWASQVMDVLSEEAREAVSVSDLVAQLQALQAQVTQAHERVHDMVRRRWPGRAFFSPFPVLTPPTPPPSPQESRVSLNLERVRQLETEAASLSAAAAAESEETCDLSPGGSVCLQSIPTPSVPATPQRKGLTSSFTDASSLRTPSMGSRLAHSWHPVQFVSKLRDGETLTAFDQPWCIRKAPSSRIGWIVTCGSRELPCALMDGMLAVWPGDTPPVAGPPQGALSPPKHYLVHAEIVVEDVPVEHGLLLENLLDLAHAPFTHTGTFAKGWGVPSAVSFAASAARSPGDGWHDISSFLAGGSRGSWNPYPIDMSFEPPCCAVSHIGLAQAGAGGGGAQFTPGTRASDCKQHLYQLHVCLPSVAGRTRLMYRMALDFAGWAKLVPGMGQVWNEMAAQVLGEDLRLVCGQQARLARGSRVWGHPVTYDKCGLAYRRFRNSASEPYTGPRPSSPLTQQPRPMDWLEARVVDAAR